MRKGFTLVEVLVSVLLMTLLMSSAMFSFKFLLNQLDKIDISIPQKAISYEYLNHSISGMYFYPIQDRKKYFFKNTYDSITFITTTPIFYSHISIAKLVLINKDLIYSESPLYTKKQDYKNPKILNNSFSIVIKKDIKKFNISIEYYKETNIPRLIRLIFDNKTWIFKIQSNHIKYKDKLNMEFSNEV